MNKVLVEVYVPALNQSYDVFLQRESRLYEVVELLNQTIKDVSKGHFIPNEATALYERDSGKPLDMNQTVEMLKIINSSQLLLI